MNQAHKYAILGYHYDDELTTSRNRLEGFSVVKGLARMDHKRNLENYTTELVARYARYSNQQYQLNLSDLPDYEQNELARLYIEFTHRETNECIYGDDFTVNSDFNCALLSMLQNDCQATREHFAEVTRKNIITYYRLSLNDLLDEACNDYIHAVNNEQGLYAHQDMEHGDVVWSKF